MSAIGSLLIPIVEKDFLLLKNYFSIYEATLVYQAPIAYLLVYRFTLFIIHCYLDTSLEVILPLRCHLYQPLGTTLMQRLRYLIYHQQLLYHQHQRSPRRLYRLFHLIRYQHITVLILYMLGVSEQQRDFIHSGI